MGCIVSVEIDLISRLEDETKHDRLFDFNKWVPNDTDRLKKIVAFLERAEKKYNEKG